MTSVRILWLLLCLLWLGAEIKLARKARADREKFLASEERSQQLIWITLATGLLAALSFKTFNWMPIPIGYLARQFIALALFTTGLSLRYYAVGRLGHLFTMNVAIHREHRLVVDGPYRWVRHPAYTGLLIAIAGAGLAMGDFLALLLLTLPSFFVFKFRIALEEQALHQRFGTAYLNYCKTSWKLLPWLF
ncbi:MAG: methyltransferase family protein [Gammaproteobacteria bacterium]